MKCIIKCANFTEGESPLYTGVVPGSISKSQGGLP